MKTGSFFPHGKRVTCKIPPVDSAKNPAFYMFYNRDERIMDCILANVKFLDLDLSTISNTTFRKDSKIFYALKSYSISLGDARSEVTEIPVLALLNTATCNYMLHKAEIVGTVLVCRV